MPVTVNEPRAQREPVFNGKTVEYVRWVIGLLIAAAVSYATAMASINREIAVLRTTQESQFGEVLRRLDIMQLDIRELRRAERER